MNKQITDRQKRFYDYIKGKPKCTYKEIKVGLNVPTECSSVLSVLMSRGLIEKRGKGKYTVYNVKESH